MTPEGFWPDELSVKQVETERLRRDILEMWKVRQEAIEECARVVESWTMHRGYNRDVAAELAAAIRALKDKP